VKTPDVLLTRDPSDGPESLAEYTATGGYDALRHALQELGPDGVMRAVADASLTGRGGAAFPTARKWELMRAGAAPRHLVANGGEHEPGSRKDRVLLTTHPHRVLEGMALAGLATGATTGHLYLIEDMNDALAACERAIAEAQAGGLLGEAIAGSEVTFTVSIARAPTSYVAGEESAALEVIEGRAALPRAKPPYPGESGLFGRPTTVNNVETLAHVPGIVRHGATWFQKLGSEGSAGTMLFTLDDAVVRPGVYELPLGATFRDLIEGCGGGLRHGARPRAILPATSAAFLDAGALELAMDHATLRAHGSSLGCGGVTIVPEGACVVERVREIAHFFRDEQCGQCPPCRMETSTIAAVLDKVMAGEAGEYTAQIERIAGFTAGKGKCSLIEMAAAPVLSALRLFPADFRHHADNGTCPFA